MEWTKDQKKTLKVLLKQKPDLKVDDVRHLFHLHTAEAIGRQIRRLRAQGAEPVVDRDLGDETKPGVFPSLEPKQSFETWEDKVKRDTNIFAQVIETGEAILDGRTLDLLRGGSYTMLELCDALDERVSDVRDALERLRGDGYRVDIRPDSVEIAQPSRAGRVQIPLDHLYDGAWATFGVISDTHLANRHERPEIIVNAYDFFEKEGVREVFHGGNWIDGYKESINKNEIVTAPTFEAQVRHFLDLYPHRPGIVTRFIDGDDHEGWFSKSLGLNCGQRLVQTARDEGRHDLDYLGYMEADIDIQKDPGGSPCILRILHPKGGSSYAVSYKAQKIVESYGEGEKPHVLLIGHLHKYDLCIPRGVYAMQIGTTASQSMFMRGNALRADIGYGVVRILVDKDGTVKRFAHEWVRYYDENYYRHKYDMEMAPERVA